MRPIFRFFLAAAAMVGPAVSAFAQQGDRPNVIWIVMDALRSDSLSCYGYERNTSPVLDALASEGVLAENHYTQGLWTTMSVPSYMTGRYFPVLVHESIQGSEIEREVPQGEMLLPEVMKENGYHTAMLTSHAWFSPKSRLWQSFDEAMYVGPSSPAAGAYATFGELNRKAFRWLEENRDRNFFLYYHILDTHFPHLPRPPFDLWIKEGFTTDKLERGMPLAKSGVKFTEEEQDYLRGIYDASLLYTDNQLGLLLWRLEALGLMENTVIVVSADHGDLLAEDGTSWGHPGVSYEKLLRTPFIMRGPGVPAGKRYSGLTENVDIVPTLIDLLGLKSGAETDGRSLLQLLEGKTPARDFALSKYTHGGYDGDQVVVLTSPPFKYEWNIAREEEFLWRVPDELPVRPNVAAEEPDALARLQGFAREQVLPKYQAYRALPPLVLNMNFRDTLPAQVSPPEAIVIHNNATYKADNSLWSDGKWGYDTDWLRLWARPWLEDLPPLHISYPAPNGRYRLELSLYVSEDYVGYPSSGLRLKAEDDTEYRSVSKTTPSGPEPEFEYVPAGEVTVSDGKIDLTLEELDDKTWVVMRGFRLLRLKQGEAGSSRSESDEEAFEEAVGRADSQDDPERIEQLRALGYVD